MTLHRNTERCNNLRKDHLLPDLLAQQLKPSNKLMQVDFGL